MSRTDPDNPARPAPGSVLCALDEIASPGARGFRFRADEAVFAGFVVRRGEAVFGYVDRCPHMGVPMAQQLDQYLTPDGSLIACSWHSALFRIDTGECVGGPCTGQRLTPWPVAVAEGQIVTA